MITIILILAAWHAIGFGSLCLVAMAADSEGLDTLPELAKKRPATVVLTMIVMLPIFGICLAVGMAASKILYPKRD